MTEVGNRAAWSAVVTGLIYNPDTAICGRWVQEKQNGNYLGLPVSDEIDDPEVPDGKQMAFSSGAVITWNPVDGTNIV